MKKTISQLEFQEEMTNYECGFTYEGSMALYDYLEDYEQSCDVELELDAIAIRCEFTQYDNLEDFHSEYDKEDYPTIEDIEDYTSVIMVDDESFIIAVF